MIKKILIRFLVLLIAIQFFRPAKNQSSVKSADDIFEHYPAPDSVKMLIRTACYDCHSGNTNYPWYAEIQPIAWWLDHHVEEGTDELNFSDFGAFDKKFKSHKMEEVMEKVKKKAMPLKSYLFLHPEARLTEAQRESIIKWANEVQNIIKAH